MTTKEATAVAGERHWVTFRFHSQQGIRNLSDAEAQTITGKDRSCHQHGLCENIAKARSPEVGAVRTDDARDERVDGTVPTHRFDESVAARGLRRENLASALQELPQG